MSLHNKTPHFKSLTQVIQALLCATFFLSTSSIRAQNNIGQIDDRCKTKNYRSIDGWGEYPVQAGQSTDNHDPRIERKGLAKITIGSKRTFQATYKILAADNTTFAQILNQDQRVSDKHKPVVFVIAEPSGSNWKLRDQGFSLGTVPKDAEFVLRIDTYYNSSNTKAYSDIYINGVKKETKTHARVGQDAQMRYGNYHHGSGTSIIRVKDVTWQTTADYLAGGGGGGTNTPPSVSVTAPSNNANISLGQTINIAANATDSDGTVDRVNFKVNGSYHSTDTDAPFAGTFTPTSAGTYTISARAFDDKGDATEKSITVNVIVANQAPAISFISPTNNATFDLGQEIPINVSASDTDGTIQKVNFKIDGNYYSQDLTGPEYTGTFSPTSPGTYRIAARAFDNEGESTEKEITVTVNALKDCNGTPGGTASIDECGVCSGGNTGLIANSCNLCETVLASSHDENIPSNVLDGDMNTRWSANGSGEFIEFCMDQETTIKSVSMAFFKGNERTTSFDLHYSLDGINYTPILSNVTSSGNTLDMEVFTFSPVTVKKLRVTGKGNSQNEWNSISEIEWAEVVTSTAKNLENEAVIIYPNPSKTGIFQLTSNAEWSVFNTQGRLIKSGTGDSIDLGTQADGLYILELNNKVIKLRKD